MEIARVRHLVERGYIPREDGERILGFLEDLRRNPRALLEYSEAEDIFEAIEIHLQRSIGESAGWFSLGRSRNDHVAAVLRLKTKRYVIKILGKIIELRRTILEKARTYSSQLFPSYTHTREAQPITFGHYLLGIEEELEDHYYMLEKTLWVIDVMPIGAGAIGGTTVEMDREELAKSLGFSRHSRNTLYMVSSRGFLIFALSIVSSLMALLCRVANDFILFSSKHYNIVRLPSRHTSTSSIMPHKVNPVTLEILRARSGEVSSILTASIEIYRATTMGYNLDFQEINRLAWRAFNHVIEALEIAIDLIRGSEVNSDRANSVSRDLEMLTADLAEIISMSRRIPHREAHRLVASKIRAGELERLFEEFLPSRDPMDLLRRKRFRGSPNPEFVEAYIAEKEKAIQADETRISTHTGSA